MSYTIIKTDQQLKTLIYDDSHITIYCTYEFGNTPVDVVNPVFKLTRGGVEVSDVRLLKHLQKDNKEQVGKYIVTFLSNDLDEATYLAEFTGTYNGNNISVKETLELKEIDRVQHLIELLRSLLNGRYNLDVPHRYLTFDPTIKQWEDGELHTCLKMACYRINDVTPSTDFNLDSIPCINYLMLGAQIYALTEVDVLEELNFFGITVPVKVDLYKGDKLRALASFIQTQFEKPLELWKDEWYLNNTNIQAVTMHRTPIRLLRPISDQIYLHSVAW
jgi:hypothetical protein